RRKNVTLYAATAFIISGLTSSFIAFAQRGSMGAFSLVRWFTSYGESGHLPMWGRWEPERILIAGRSALGSILPSSAAIPISQISWNVQLGRVAVDLAIVGFAILSLMALVKTRKKAVSFLLAYFFFFPFIVWL